MLFYPSSIFWKPLRVLLFLLLFYSSSFESCLRGNMIIHPSILSHFSCVQLSATLWTKACQASLSMGFSMQEYWSGLPYPPPGESSCQSRRPRFDLWFEKIPWRRKWQPTPVFLHGKFHGQRSLVGCRPQSCKRVGHN